MCPTFVAGMIGPAIKGTLGYDALLSFMGLLHTAASCNSYNSCNSTVEFQFELTPVWRWRRIRASRFCCQ